MDIESKIDKLVEIFKEDFEADPNVLYIDNESFADLFDDNLALKEANEYLDEIEQCDGLMYGSMTVIIIHHLGEWIDVSCI